MDIFDEILNDLGITPVVAATPELGMYIEWTEGKMPKIYNCQYWLKHELCVYTSLLEKSWFISKPNKAFTTGRSQVNLGELTRALLEYYFLMVAHAKFHNERAKEQGKQVNMVQFLDLVMEHSEIKKLIENPHRLI